MIVFNLACDHGHTFEGWFGSTQDFESQQARSLVSCPVCGSHAVQKQLSAPRLNLSNAAPPVDAPSTSTSPAPSNAVMAPEQAQLMAMIRQVIENTEDVGPRFAEEARKIHYKEVDARAIRGVASKAEAEALAEEGIEVAALPFPVRERSQLN
jgi:hypothetical protein